MNQAGQFWSALAIFFIAGAVSADDEVAPRPELKPPGDELTLAEAIDLALSHNLDLQIERTRTDDAWQILEIARSDFDPTLNGSAGSNFSLAPRSSTQLDGSTQPERRAANSDASLEKKLTSGATVGLRSEVLDRSKTNSSFTTLNPEFNTAVRLEVRQPLLKSAGFRYNLSPIRIADLGIDASDQQLLAKFLEILRDTENGYWDVVAAQAERDITERSIELSTRIVEEAVERKEAALATETDVLEAQASLAEREELLLQAEANVETRRDELFRQLGVIRMLDPLSVGVEELPGRVRLDCDPKASFELARNYAPSLRIASLQASVQEEELARQRNQLRPQVDLTFSTGALGRDGSFGGAHSSLRDVDGHFWDGGLTVSIPLGNRAERARMRQAENALERAQLTEEKSLIDLYTLVRAACREVELSFKRFDATSVTLDFAERSLEQQRANYGQGQVTIRDVVSAQNDLDNARFRQVQARIRELNAIVQLAELEGSLPKRYGLEIEEPRKTQNTRKGF